MRERSDRWKRGQELLFLHTDFADDALKAMLLCIPGAVVKVNDDGELIGWDVECAQGDIEALEALADQRASERLRPLCTVDEWSAFRNAMSAEKRIANQRRANGRTESPRLKRIAEEGALLRTIVDFRRSQVERGQELLQRVGDLLEAEMIEALSCIPGAEVIFGDSGEVLGWNTGSSGVDLEALEQHAVQQATDRLRPLCSGSDWIAFEEAIMETRRIAKKRRLVDHPAPHSRDGLL